MTFRYPETFEYGITRFFEADEQIAVVRAPYHVNRDAVDAWGMIMMDTIHRALPTDRKFIVCDLSDKTQTLTPYAKAKTQQIFASVPPESQIYTAVILPNTVTFRLIGVFVAHQARQAQNITLRSFVNYETGLMWLKGLL